MQKHHGRVVDEPSVDDADAENMSGRHDAQSHADDREKVNMETGSRISVWRPFAFGKRKY